MKKLINISKLKQDLSDALRQRSIKVSTVKALNDENPRHTYLRAVGTNEINKVLDDVFANIDNEEEITDLAEFYAAELRKLADNIEETRCKIWQTQKSDKEDKEEITDKLFKIQSDLRDVANLVSWNYFGD